MSLMPFALLLVPLAHGNYWGTGWSHLDHDIQAKGNFQIMGQKLVRKHSENLGNSEYVHSFKNQQHENTEFKDSYK